MGRPCVIALAGVALIAKLIIAWTTIGTNDVISFYRFGRSLATHGLEWTYVSDISFNHPPLVAAYLRLIYFLDQNPWLHENGIGFPLLLRLPGIVADFVVVLTLLNAAKELRLPLWSLAILALSPVSLMISGFHGNTDSIMVMFLVLAASMCLQDRPILSALFLALSCQIKIISLLVLPIFLCYWLHRRRVLFFTLPFLVTLVSFWILPILKFPVAFLHRVLLYGSFWGIWGITYWLRLTGVKELSRVTYSHLLPLQQMIGTGLKLTIIGLVLLIAWRRRKLDGRGLFASLGWGWVFFFILSPGVCAQYLVWLMPFTLVLSPGFFVWLTAASSIFLFFFYNSISGGLPWYLAISTGNLTVEWVPWSLWPWLTLIAGALLVWNRTLTANPSFRLCSLDSINPTRL